MSEKGYEGVLAMAVSIENLYPLESSNPSLRFHPNSKLGHVGTGSACGFQFTARAV